MSDDALFKLWRENKMYVEDVLSIAQNPDELARRIVNAKRDIMKDEPSDDGHGGGSSG